MKSRKGISEIILPASRHWRHAKSIGKIVFFLYVSVFFILQISGYKIDQYAPDGSLHIYQNSTLWILGMVFIISFLLYANFSGNQERLLLNRPNLTATLRLTAPEQLHFDHHNTQGTSALLGQVKTVTFTETDMQHLEMTDSARGPMITVRSNNKEYELGQALNTSEKHWLFNTLDVAYRQHD